MPVRYQDQTYEKYSVGVFSRPGDGDEAQAVLLHESPPDQEMVKIVLLEGYLCTLEGKVIDVPRREFSVICTQGDL